MWHLEHFINSLFDSYACVPVWHLEHFINSLFDSYACVPVWHLKPGLVAWFDSSWDPGIITVWIASWFSLIADELYLYRYVSVTFYGVGVYYRSPFLSFNIVKFTDRGGHVTYPPPIIL